MRLPRIFKPGILLSAFTGPLSRRAGTLFLSNSLGQALAFLTSAAAGRLLGVTAFGEYASVMALVFVLGLLVEAGMETTLTRDIAREPARSESLLITSLRTKAVLGGALAIVLALPVVAQSLAPSPGAVLAVQLSGLLLTLNACNSSFGAVFRAWGKMQYVLSINVAGLAIQLAGAVSLLLAFRSVAVLVGWFVAVQVLELAGGVILFRRGASQGVDTSPGPLSPRAGLSGLLLLRRSWPFALAGVVGALLLRVDLFLIEGLRGPAEVGVYSVATRLHELLGLAPNSFYAALLPALSATHGTGGHPASIASFHSALRKMALAAPVAAIAGLVLADVLVLLSFGGAYSAAAPPLRVLAVLLIPLLVNRTISVYLFATDREGLAIAALVLDLALRFALGYLLIGGFGSIGAAVANVIAECCVFVFFWMRGGLYLRRSTEC